MIDLPMVTLFAIDCVTAMKTLNVMLNAAKQIKFAEIVMMTNTTKFNKLPGGVRYVHREQGDLMVKCGSRKAPLDYEIDVLTESHKHVRTSHLLHMEWDSLVCNTFAWNHEWLNYDYIGAPWPYPLKEEGFPIIGKHNNVGNGGFSLKSRRFCSLVASIADKSLPVCYSSDLFQCVVARSYLQKKGMKYAPSNAAERFSCENNIYSGQFGLHGKNTLSLNGINIKSLEH